MNFEERDKIIIKNISSNIIRGEREEEDISKIYYLTKVVNDSCLFSIVLHGRNDYKHSLEYIKTAINVNKEIETILAGIYDNIKEKVPRVGGIRRRNG